MTAVSLLARLLPALLAIATALPATAQDYPTKPIRFTICCAPGGSADLVTRLLAEKMAARMGQPVLPENRIGGSGVRANGDVVKAAGWKAPQRGVTGLAVRFNLLDDESRETCFARCGSYGYLYA